MSRLAEAREKLGVKFSSPPWRERELEWYEENRGPDALMRQVDLGIQFRCCWQPKDGPHHAACTVGDRG